MPIDVSPILKEMLGPNRGPDPFNPERRRPPDYGINASLEGHILSMVLTFRKGSPYCCMEWGCHLPLYKGKRWEELRQALAAHDVAAPPMLELRLFCVIEEGAVFFDPSGPEPEGWYGFKPVAAFQYQVSSEEGESVLEVTQSEKRTGDIHDPDHRR